MHDTITGAPSLGEVVAALDAAEIQECHVNGDKADVISAPPGSNFLAEHRLIARCATGPLWIKQAVAIAKALNFVRALAAAPPSEALAQAVAAAREETEKTREALKIAMQFVDRACGEGLGFDADEEYPATDAMDVCIAVADVLGIEKLDSDAYRDLVTYPPTPAQTDTAPGGRA